MKIYFPSRMLIVLILLGMWTISLRAQEAGDLVVPTAPEEEDQPPVEEFLDTMKLVDGLRVYNQQLETLLADQQREINQLNESIERTSIIERQIGPLTERMIETLSAFIELDIPFLLEKRRQKIAELRATLDRSDIPASEKFMEVMRAYEEEIEYGSTKEAYVDIIDIEGKPRQVDVLRWGRVVLAFQTPDGQITGAWDNEARQWQILGDEYTVGIRDGLRIARKTMTDDLVILPTQAPHE